MSSNTTPNHLSSQNQNDTEQYSEVQSHQEQQENSEGIRDIEPDGVLGILDTVLKDLRSIQTTIEEIKKNVNENKKVLKDIEKKQTELLDTVSKLNCHSDIEKLIFGKWKNKSKKSQYFSAKFNGDLFMTKWNNDDNFKEYKKGVRHENGVMISVESDKIVHTEFLEEEEETYRRELYFKKGTLKLKEIRPGKKPKKYNFKRIGDPDEDQLSDISV